MRHQLNILLCSKCKSFLIQKIRRYAGHSKWQNIKATKQARDNIRAKVFKTLMDKMKIAVTENGSANPSYNTKLASIIEQAKKVNMPSNTINLFLERLQNSGQQPQIQIVTVHTSEKCILILYVLTDKFIMTRSHIHGILKKHNAKVADSALSIFDCGSYVIASKDCNIDQAIEDAIQVNAEDVQELEEEGKRCFMFKCEFLFPDKIETQLMNLGYSILSTKHTCIPNSMVELSDEQLQTVNNLKKKLLELNEIVKIEDNIAQ